VSFLIYLKWGRVVRTSHSATGAIESALKYVSPDAHWIARRLATAGGKTYKNAAPQHNWHRPFGPAQLQQPVPNQSRPVTSRYYNNCETTAQLRAQRSPAGKRLDSSLKLHESCRPVQISAVPHHFSHDFAPLLAVPGATQQQPDSTRRHHAWLVHHNAPATQRGSARPTTHSLPAEPSLFTFTFYIYMFYLIFGTM
jgi:hypothetical protein